MSETPKKSLMDSLTDMVNKLAVPLGKFGMLPPIAAIQNGMIAAMPVIMVGAAPRNRLHHRTRHLPALLARLREEVPRRGSRQRG